MSHRFVVIAMSRDVARVWNAGIDPGSPALVLYPAHENAEYRKEREAREGGRFDEKFDREYFEAIATALTGAEEILMVGHGKGKSSWMLLLTQFLEQKHPDVARNVVDAVNVDVENMSERQVIALAREWRELNKFNRVNS